MLRCIRQQGKKGAKAGGEGKQGKRTGEKEDKGRGQGKQGKGTREIEKEHKLSSIAGTY